jgi:hypothetical protein
MPHGPCDRPARRHRALGRRGRRELRVRRLGAFHPCLPACPSGDAFAIPRPGLNRALVAYVQAPLPAA